MELPTEELWWCQFAEIEDLATGPSFCHRYQNGKCGTHGEKCDARRVKLVLADAKDPVRELLEKWEEDLTSQTQHMQNESREDAIMRCQRELRKALEARDATN